MLNQHSSKKIHKKHYDSDIMINQQSSKKISIKLKLLIKLRFIWLKSSFLKKNILYLSINNLKTKKIWVIHTPIVKEKLTSFTQKT